MIDQGQVPRLDGVCKPDGAGDAPFSREPPYHVDLLRQGSLVLFCNVFGDACTCTLGGGLDRSVCWAV